MELSSVSRKDRAAASGAAGIEGSEAVDVDVKIIIVANI
jgi:hypothetical protein